MKLSQKFLALFLSAALGPLSLAGVGLLRGMEVSLRRSSLDVQRGVARRTAESVAAYLENVRGLLTVVRKTPGFWDGEGFGGRAVFKTVLDNHPGFEDLTLFTAGGRPVYRLHRFAGEPFPFTPPAAGDGPAYQETLERDARGRPRLRVLLPIEDGDGRVRGFLAGRLNLLDLSARLKGLDLGAGALVLLADARGGLIGHSSEKDLFREGARVPAEVLGPDWREGEYGDGAGESLLGVKAPVPGKDWFVVFQQPSASAFRAVRKARRWIGGLLLAAALLATGSCLWLTGLLVRRLGLIQKAVEDMKEGRFESDLPVEAGDEVGSLAREILEAQKALARKVRQATIGRMALRVGHDLRQPLINIRNSLALVRTHAKGMDAVAVKHLALIEDEIAQGLDAVEDVLALGRERPPNRRREWINGLVSSWTARLSPPAGVSLSSALMADPPDCEVDAKELSRAFFNAVRNALEAVGPGGKVLVRTRTGEGRVWIDVSDDGPGIPPERRERVFEDFFTTKAQGTGLGLGIIRRVMERHGGEARLRERPGGGTVVEMGLPAAPAPAPATAEA